MPIAGISGGKGPNETLRREPGLHPIVFGHIIVIIEVDEVMMQHLPIGQPGGHDENEADQNGTLHVGRLIHNLL